MSAARYIRPWHGRVYRHLPGSSPFGPLDTRFARRSHEQHWSQPGEPTLYLALDRAILSNDFDRHLRRDRSPAVEEIVQTRRIFAFEIALERVYDLTDPASFGALGITGAPACFRERAIARATAGFLRDVIGVEAMLAPSSDTGSRILILFLDRLESPLSDIAHSIEAVGSFRLVPATPSPEPS